MKKQELPVSCKLPASCKRASSPTDENITLDTKKHDGTIIQYNMAPPPKRIKNRHDCCDKNETLWCTPINSLPIEILDQVFSYLGVKQRLELESVCKRWNRIGRQLRWQWPTCLSLHIKRPLLAVSAIEAMLFRCGKSLRKLQVLKGCNGDEIRSCISRRTMEIIAQHCPNLEYIILSGLRLPNLCLQTLAEGCPNLKTVCLRDSFGYSETGLMDFLELCKELECLDINGPVIGQCFNSVSPKLKILRLRSSKFRTVGLESVMNRCLHLCELRMPSCFIPPLVLTTFLEKYKDTLTILALDGWRCIDWCNALHVLQNLEVLSLVNCYRIDDELMNRLSRECHNLRDLSVCNSQMTDLGLSHLIALPYLTVLDVSDNYWFTGAGVKRVAMEGRLEELYARYTSSQPSYIIELARLCPNLRTVDLSRNMQISNVVVEAFCDAINAGCLKGPLNLFVGETNVNEPVKRCDQLQLSFKVDPCCHRLCNALHGLPYPVDI